MTAYPPHLRHVEDAIGRLRGSRRLGEVFSGDKALAAVPWPRAPRLPGGHLFDRDAVAREFEHRLPAVALLDPGTLWASQPSVTRPGVEYYTAPVWFRSGVTYADPRSQFNRLPVVEIRADGARVILNGHHRSCAALLHDRPVLARLVSLVPDAEVERVDLRLPCLALTAWSSGIEVSSLDQALAVIETGQAVRVTSETLAERVADALASTVPRC